MMKPAEFAKLFNDEMAVIANGEEAQNWKSDRKWTETLSKRLEVIGKGYDVRREFYRLDMAYFSPAKVAAFPTLPNLGWNLDVAIEYENNPKTWPHEFVKLGHLEAGLRVLISYHDFGDQNGRPVVAEKKQVLIKSLQDLFDMRSSLSPFCTDDRWLFLFGHHKVGPVAFEAYGVCEGKVVELARI